MQAWVSWLILGLALLIIEMFTMTMFLMWVGAGALLAALAAALHAPNWAQWLVFAASSLILLWLSRPLARSVHGRVTVPSNVDSLVGQSAVVLEAIDPQANTGRVRIGSDEWRARADQPIKQGAGVVVEKVQGTTLRVREKNVEQATENG